MGMCFWPITDACALIQTQRPDAHLLLDFFQPTVDLCFSWPAIKMKYAVQTNGTINPLFNNESAQNSFVLSLDSRGHNACDFKR